MINYSANKSFADYQDFPLFTDKSKYTDDTVLTCAIANAIIFKKPFDEVLKLYGRKFPLAGYGSAFIQWLDSPLMEPYNSYGNGSAMRVSPVGWLYDTREDVLRVAAETANPTHNHPEGVKGAQAIALAILLSRKGEPKAQIKFEIENSFGYNLNRTLDEIRQNYEFSATCQLTVPEAITAFLESENFEDAIRKAISIGGDSDTIACMAGAIAEAFYGTDSIPPEIKKQTIEILSKEEYLFDDFILFESYNSKREQLQNT